MLNTSNLDTPTADLLRAALEVAVPPWIEVLLDLDQEFILRRAQACARMVTERGDALQFGSKSPGKSAEVLDRLAEGLAALAIITPGGVKFLGLHFEAGPASPAASEGQPSTLP